MVVGIQGQRAGTQIALARGTLATFFRTACFFEPENLTNQKALCEFANIVVHLMCSSCRPGKCTAKSFSQVGLRTQLVLTLNKTTDPKHIREMSPTLTDVIHVIPPDKDETVEDIFACAPGLIFADDTRNFHGDPGSTIVYKSVRFGNIELKTTDPDREEERQLFGHYLWNAGIKMAELISGEGGEKWCVKGRKVLELGAGQCLQS